ncbi:MAG TPA: hypothetical protein PK265_02095 [Candidatus Saccharibacteria bacterium]|nr:hypothetical protein [Candidatus Saccharibacteria bacterium]HRQ98097.1 hypothetical protein [Candidatus Saccharibacteria bacterium]
METLNSGKNVDRAINELRNINEKGSAHRDFLQAQLDEIEYREQQLAQQLQKCREEAKIVHEHSRQMGPEYQKRTRDLSISAIKLINLSSNETSNRVNLWSIVAEATQRHYKTTEERVEYAHTLTYLDDTLRTATLNDTSLPILLADKTEGNPPYLQPRTVAFQYDISANGLSFNYPEFISVSSHDFFTPSILALSKPESIQIPLQKSLNQKLRIYEDIVSVSRTETKLILGKNAITNYALMILHEDKEDDAYKLVLKLNTSLPEVGQELNQNYDLVGRFSHAAQADLVELNFDNPNSVNKYRALRQLIPEDEDVKKVMSIKYPFAKDVSHKFKLFESLITTKAYEPNLDVNNI